MDPKEHDGVDGPDSTEPGSSEPDSMEPESLESENIVSESLGPKSPDLRAQSDVSAPPLDDLPLEQLMALLHATTQAVKGRLSRPDALRDVVPLPHSSGVTRTALPSGDVVPDAAAGDRPESVEFTLPVLQQTLEHIGRSVMVAQMCLTGHASDTYENPAERQRLLGLPPGKTAFRDTTDYLKMVLRIDGTEAKRRLRWVAGLRPRQSMTGETLEPLMPVLSAGVHSGQMDRAAVDLIAHTLNSAQSMARRVGAGPEVVGPLMEDGEQRLVQQALSVDPGTLRKVANHWLRWFEATVDPDGAEPNDADLPHLQGMIRKGHRHGLHHWLLSVNDEQNEYLETIAGAATNPRAALRTAHGARMADGAPLAEVLSETDGSAVAVPAVDPRSRNQRQLDGLIACIAGGLALIESDQLPSSGGQRPQVAVTIDMDTLVNDLARVGGITGVDLDRFESSATYTGAVHPSMIRTLACDADILPVVLGGRGEVPDVGRAQRLFPARMRQAIATRDGGCTAPGCWIPAPWCDVHHVDHWEHGGPTSVDNGVLLCNHHHHAVHAGAWEIDMGTGQPWFIPAPYLDPRRQPQRNLYWRR